MEPIENHVVLYISSSNESVLSQLQVNNEVQLHPNAKGCTPPESIHHFGGIERSSKVVFRNYMSLPPHTLTVGD